MDKMRTKKNNIVLLVLVLISETWAAATLNFLGIISVNAFIALIFLFQKKGRQGFIAIIFLKPIIDLAWDVNLFETSGPSVNILKIAGIGIPIICIVYIITSPKKTLITTNSFGIIFFIILNFISIAIYLIDTYDIGNTLFEITAYVFKLLNGFMLFIVIPYIFDKKEDDKIIIKTLFYSTIIPTLVSIYLYATGSYNITTGQGIERFAGVYHDAGGLSINAFIGLTIGLFVLSNADTTINYKYNKNLTIKFLIVLQIVANLFFIYISFTRIMYLVTLIFLFFWFFLYYKHKLLSLTILPIVVFSIFNTEEFQQRSWKEIKTIETYKSTGNISYLIKFSGGGRIDKWERAWQIFDNLSIGKKILGSGSGVAAHNEYIDIIIRSGFLGLFVFLISVFFLLKSLYLNFKIFTMTELKFQKGLNLFGFILLICLCVLSFTGYTISQTTFGIYIWSVLSCALNLNPSFIGKNNA